MIAEWCKYMKDKINRFIESDTWPCFLGCIQGLIIGVTVIALVLIFAPWALPILPALSPFILIATAIFLLTRY